MIKQAVKSESKDASNIRAGTKAHNRNFEKTDASNNADNLIIWRKSTCACGGDCPLCQTEDSSLPVSQPTDASEIEADLLADKVMRMSDDESASLKQNQSPTLAESVTPIIQTKSEGENESSASSALSGKIASLQSGGSAMDDGTQSFMQSRFGADFSGVKIHTGTEAAQMNRELSANAFTVGNHIYFNEGQFQPSTEAGKRLLAHELAHVVQQEKSGLCAQPQIQREKGKGSMAPAENPDAADAIPENTLRQGVLRFHFRTETDIPAAIQGDSNTPFMIWAVKMAFKIHENTAERIVSLIQWQPVSNTRSYKAGDVIEYTLSIEGILMTLRILAAEGRIEAEAVEKFESIIALQASMTHRDLEFFGKATQSNFSDLNVDGFTVENLDKIEKKISDFMSDKESFLRARGLLDDYYRAEDTVRALDFEELKDKFYGKSFDDLTEADKEQILSLFRDKAMRKTFLMLEKSNTIARKELARYTSNKQELSDLITLLTGTYGLAYSEADKLRVKGIYKFIDKYNPDYRSTAGGSDTNNFRKFLRFAPKGEEELLKVVSQIPAADIEWQLANFFVHATMRSRRGLTMEEAREEGKSIVNSEFPEFEAANRRDAITAGNMSKESADKYPILHDLSLDFRLLSRLPADVLEAKILEELADKEKKSAQTQRYLIKEPWRIWEFEPLLRGVMIEEGLSKDDAIGKVINEKIESIKEDKFWRSIGLAALGIALGIAGFFTGGATWIGIGLIAGSVVVNLIDLHYELQDYALHSAAAEATFEGGLTHAPSSIGLIFAIGGLVLDFVDVLKILKPLAKPLSNADEVAAYAADAYKNLKAAGKIKEGITEEAFIKELVENWKKRDQMIQNLAPEVKAIVEGKAFTSLHQGIQEGLFRVFDADAEAFSHLMKTFADNPEVLARLGAQAMLNTKAAEGIAGVFRLFKESAPAYLDDVLRYYGSVGGRALFNLPDVLDILRRGTIPNANPELAKLILTNRKLQQSVLTHSTDPDVLLRYWEQYQNELKAGNLASDTDFVKYLDEQKAGTKLAESSAGIPQKVDFTVENIEITAKLTDRDLAMARKLIDTLVKEKGFISAEQMQAIIRTAEAADLSATVSKNLRGFLYQLNTAAARIADVGMKPENVFAFLRGFENGDEIATTLKLLDYIGSGGVKGVDEILSSMTISKLGDLILLEGETLKIGDVYSAISKIKVSSNASTEVLDLAMLAGEAAGKSSDLRRLDNILESLGEGPHTYDVVVKAIEEANVFDQKVAKALSEGGLEDMARLVWGEKGIKGARGKVAYNAVLGNPEKADKLIKGIMNGAEIDPVKWAILRKTIVDANISGSIKNNIIGELWAKASIESYTAQGYKLFKREVPIRYKNPVTGEIERANADAVMTKGDETFVLEFKSGEAVFSKGQEVIYPIIQKGEWDNLTIGVPELDALVKADPAKVKFTEVREPYN